MPGACAKIAAFASFAGAAIVTSGMPDAVCTLCMLAQLIKVKHAAIIPSFTTIISFIFSFCLFGLP